MHTVYILHPSLDAIGQPGGSEPWNTLLNRHITYSHACLSYSMMPDIVTVFKLFGEDSGSDSEKCVTR